jgi:ribonuclease HI
MKLGWAERWRSNGWWRNKKERALNPDLWKRLLEKCEYHIVRFKWVRGHAGNIENERCDKLAMSAARRRNLPSDQGYVDK